MAIASAGHLQTRLIVTHRGRAYDSGLRRNSVLSLDQNLQGAIRRLPLVKVGVVGLGSDWVQRLSPAIEKMQSRVRVVAVCDDIAISARAAATRWHADAILGVRALLMRQDIDAILLRSAGWQRDWLLDCLRERKLPILLGPEVALTDAQVDALSRSHVHEGTIIVPELAFRYMPATLRLRELQATTLGKAAHLLIHAAAWSSLLARCPSLVPLLDWCTSLMEGVPTSVAPTKAPLPKAGGERVTITYDNPRSSNDLRSVVVVLEPESETGQISSKAVADESPSLCELVCDRGTAVIESPSGLRWTVGGETKHEQLGGDRSSTEVVLDLFARRVLGGLIPTPGPGDLQRARMLAHAFETARKERLRVALPGKQDLG